jgi:hypothetical protein
MSAGEERSNTELAGLVSAEVPGPVKRGTSTGRRVKLRVLVAPGAVIGRCGRGVPHIPQNRWVAELLLPQWEQTTLPPAGKPILNYRDVLKKWM